MGWADCARQMGPWLGLMACVVLGVVLIQETIFYDGYVAITRLVGVMLKVPGAADMKPALPDELMAPAAIAIVACAIVALIVAGLCFAVLPGRDPIGFSERSRKAYVYSAEVLLVLLFVHFKITMPGLFKITTVKKKAVPARKGINPFTGEETMFKAKPARTVIKIRALKKMKDMV